MALNLDETQGAVDRYATGEQTDVVVNDDFAGAVAGGLRVRRLGATRARRRL